jgi:CRISPR-associated protein Cmr6
MNVNDVPMMFRAQIDGRGNLQRVPARGEQHPAYKWAQEWTENYPQPPKQEENLALQTASIKSDEHAKSPPKFVSQASFDLQIKKREYFLNWRLITNCGQDDTIIRPVIGSRGYPFFPGSSMKGAFRRAWKHLYGEDENYNQKLQYYCGTPAGTADPKPGCLRFHGGYPTDTRWIRDLVDVINPQEEWQTQQQGGARAKTAISLKEVKFEFGISSTIKLKDDQWYNEIWVVWERALAEGLGSRTSAGYGRFIKDSDHSKTIIQASDHILASVRISGYGLSSKLFNDGQNRQKNEFRPNMFKAALRGHTLRFLGGLTDADSAKYLTKLLWGGTGGDPISAAFDTRKFADSAIVGLLSVNFQGKPTGNDDRYKIEDGCLTISLNRHDLNLTDTQKTNLQDLAKKLLQFSVIFAGFGKSWRRVDHHKFYKSSYQQQIGCHWWFADGNEEGYQTVKQTSDLATVIYNVQNSLQQFAQAQIATLGQNTAQGWREAWYPYQNNVGGVQVWASLNGAESLAIHWFHQTYQGQKSIKHTELTGWADQNPAQIGRIWHRMYPINLDHSQHLEILTIFPDTQSSTAQFLAFLAAQNSGFSHIF